MEISLLKNQEIQIKGKNSLMVILPLGLYKEYDEAALKANCILSPSTFEKIENLTSEIRAFNWPGEMEMAGISIKSIKMFPDEEKSSLAFIILIDGFSLCYLSDTAKDIPKALIESIGNIDILIFPLDGSKIIHEMIEELEPKAILPITDRTNTTDLDTFLNKLGIPKPEVKFKLSINSKTEFKPDSMGIYLLV